MPSIASTVFAVVIALIAVFFIVVGALAWRRALPGNGVIGLRVPEVRKEERIWKEAHQVAGPMWMLAGVALLFSAAFALREIWWLVPLPALASIAFVSIGANLGARAANLLANHKEPQPEPEAPKVNLDAVRRAAQGGDAAN